MKLFGTDGIRGRANTFPITAEVALRLGKAIAQVLRSADPSQRCVIIGRDTRNSGSLLEAAVTSGLLACGMDVAHAGILPTPGIAFLTKSTHAAAGVMITASHNPFEDNGLKIFGPDGFKLSDALETLIERHILGEEPEPAPLPPQDIGQLLELPNAAALYGDFVKSSIGTTSLHGLKIVLDCGNGAASHLAPCLFQDLGAEVIPFATQPNGLNINAACGALHPEAAAALVLQHRADIGISLDGDADRVIFTDASGQVVTGDRVLGLCAIGLKERGQLANDTLVATVMSNLGLVEAMETRGIRVVATAVGDRSVIESMRKNGHSFGGENSGHLIFGQHSTTGDGILSALQVLRMMLEKKATLAQLAAIMEEYPTQLANLPVPAKPPLESLPQLQALMRQATTEFGSAGRHLIRYSGTESKIRVLVEHREATTVERWITAFTAAIHQEIGACG